MIAPSLDIDTSLFGYRVQISVPLTSLQDAFAQLVQRNDEARARDADPSLRPARSVRMRCPQCDASVFSLTSFSCGEDGIVRACRRCLTVFPVED